MAKNVLIFEINTRRFQSIIKAELHLSDSYKKSVCGVYCKMVSMYKKLSLRK